MGSSGVFTEIVCKNDDDNDFPHDHHFNNTCDWSSISVQYGRCMMNTSSSNPMVTVSFHNQQLYVLTSHPDTEQWPKVCDSRVWDPRLCQNKRRQSPLPPPPPYHTMSFPSANHVWTKIKQDFFTIFPWGEKKREGRIHMCQHRNYSTYLIYRDALSTTSSKIANANREFPDWGEIAITDDCLRIYSHHIKSSRMTITVVSFISSACKTRLHSYHLVCVYIPLTLVQ